METSDFRSASRLQMSSFMKPFAVVILALVLASGCGVGADESYDGVTLVSANGEALEGSPVLPTTSLPQPSATPTPSTVRDPSTVALPQDPIPVYEGRPATQPQPLMNPAIKPVMR